MNREDIIRMAREARLIRTGDGWTEPHRWGMDEIERFAALVAAAEREACADFLERGVDLAGLAGDPVMQKYTVELLLGCSAAIRRRGVL